MKTIILGFFIFFYLFYLVFVGNLILKGENSSFPESLTVAVIEYFVFFILIYLPIKIFSKSKLFGDNAFYSDQRLFEKVLNRLITTFLIIIIFVKHTPLLPLLNLSSYTEETGTFSIVGYGLTAAIIINLIIFAFSEKPK